MMKREVLPILYRRGRTTVPVTIARRPPADWWAKFAFLLALGYFCMSRSFAYLGLPAHGIFIGEVVLAAFLLLAPRMRRGGWLWLAIRGRRLRRVELLMLASLAYGGLEVLRGISAGFGTFAAFRGAAFNYYALFLFWGFYAGLRERTLALRLVRALAWCNGIYGTAYVLFLNRVDWMIPGTSGSPSAVPVFSLGWTSGVTLLGLFAFERKLSRVWYLIAVNLFVLLGLEVRGEWMGFAVGLFVFALCTQRIQRLGSIMIAGTLLAAVLVLMTAWNLSLPATSGRGGGRISLNYFLARVTAPLDRRLAHTFAPDEYVNVFAANADWRLSLWRSVWGAVNQSPSTALVGLGYGYPMWNLIEPARALSKAPLQSTHNDLVYALGFTGWIGVTIFVLLQIEIARLLFRAFRVTRQPFGLVAWSALLTLSMFESYFESPFGAIPFYLLIGITIAPAVFSQHPNARIRAYTTWRRSGPA